MDIGIAEMRKSEKNIGGGGESNIEGAELSIGGAEGHPKSIQIDTSEHLSYRRKPLKLFSFTNLWMSVLPIIIHEIVRIMSLGLVVGK